MVLGVFHVELSNTETGNFEKLLAKYSLAPYCIRCTDKWTRPLVNDGPISMWHLIVPVKPA